MFLLDATKSMNYPYDVTQSMARRIVDGLSYNNGRTRVAMITFQVEAALRFDLQTYTDKACQ